VVLYFVAIYSKFVIIWSLLKAFYIAAEYQRPKVSPTSGILSHFPLLCYSYCMAIEQTVEIPASHRLTIEVPREVPAGRTVLTFTPVHGSPAREKAERQSEARDIEFINQNAERLNREALDVLSFQSLDI